MCMEHFFNWENMRLGIPRLFFNEDPASGCSSAASRLSRHPGARRLAEGGRHTKASRHCEEGTQRGQGGACMQAWGGGWGAATQLSTLWPGEDDPAAVTLGLLTV